MRVRRESEAIEDLKRQLVMERAATARLRLDEAKYQTLFNSIDEGVTTLDMIFDDRGEVVDYRFVEYNPMAEKLTGLSGIEGKRVSEVLSILEDVWLRKLERVVKTGEAQRFEEYNAGIEKWLDVHVSRVGDEGSPRSFVFTPTSPSASAPRRRCARARSGRLSC